MLWERDGKYEKKLVPWIKRKDLDRIIMSLLFCEQLSPEVESQAYDELQSLP